MYGHGRLAQIASDHFRFVQGPFVPFPSHPPPLQETEVAQIASDQFRLVQGPFAHKFYAGGYGAVYTPRLEEPGLL